jgi:hypothetical protein
MPHSTVLVVSGSVDQWWKVLPRRSRDQTQATRGDSDRPQATRAIGASRALCLCVKHPWFPTGVLHCPGHPSCAGAYISLAGKLMRYGVDALPHVCAMCVKKVWSVLGARRQNLSRLRVEKLGCAGSRQVIPAVSLMGICEAYTFPIRANKPIRYIGNA